MIDVIVLFLTCLRGGGRGKKRNLINTRSLPCLFFSRGRPPGNPPHPRTRTPPTCTRTPAHTLTPNCTRALALPPPPPPPTPTGGVSQ